MSRSASKRRAGAWASVLTVFAAAIVFWWVQNHWQPVGGAMAFQKALWLADAGVHARVRHAFKALLILMVLRGVIELWMLYVTLNWSPWYGIAHDVLCMAVLAWFLLRFAADFQPLWRMHAAVTALAFAPEIYFAWYMQKYFHTQGDAAVYFVPDDPAHAFALNVTWVAVVCFSVHIFVFLFRWLNAASDSGGEGAR